KAILEAVGRGEEVVVTHRGKARAKIVPAASSETARTTGQKRKSALFGIWKDNKAVRDVNAYIDRLRRGRAA
ncbi:MAG: type II toxin-antitoxin system Phd/YefM family antitoxin, partial [Burkholderiales bacterium]